jgi:hypothetical protein
MGQILSPRQIGANLINKLLTRDTGVLSRSILRRPPARALEVMAHLRRDTRRTALAVRRLTDTSLYGGSPAIEPSAAGALECGSGAAAFLPLQRTRVRPR